MEITVIAFERGRRRGKKKKKEEKKKKKRKMGLRTLDTEPGGNRTV